MSIIESSERRGWRAAVSFTALLLLAVGVLVGWSRLGEDVGEGADVLGEVFMGRSTGNSGKSTPGQGQANNPGNGQPAPPGGNPRTFGISGNLDEIYPTFDGTLEVAFTNPHRFEIVVTDLDVSIFPPSSEGSADCVDALDAHLDDEGAVGEGIFRIGDGSMNVEVDPATGSAPRSKSVSIPFEVLNYLPNDCQVKQFELIYTGTAIRANQQ